MCYQIHGKKRIGRLNWDKASEACKDNYGGNLVSIHTQELQDFLTAFLLLSARDQVWIGLHDQTDESDYQWDDGSPVDFTNWESTEPSGTKRGEEDCTEMIFQPWKAPWKSGNWNDASCWNTMQYICQRKKGIQKKIYPDPRLCKMADSDEKGWKFENSCFHLVTAPKNWSEAEQYCQDEFNAHLATITDFAVGYYLTYVFKDMKQGAWIGIKMNPEEEQQKWNSGWFVSYENWDMDEMEERIGCVVFTREGKWIHKPCTRELPFICEYSTALPPVLKPGPEGSSCPKQPQGWRDLGGDLCYFFDTKAEVTWPEANFQCMRRGGTLASIHSKEEINVLHNFVRYSVSEKFYDVYIGLYRRQHDDEFAWADGSIVDFKNWAPNQDSSQHEQCVEIERETFLWNDIECEKKRGYFCTVPKIGADNATEEASVIKNPRENADSNRFSIGAVVGVMICVLFVAFLIGIVAYHFRLCDRGSDRTRRTQGNKLESPSAMDQKPRYRSSEFTVTDDDALYENMTP